MARTWLTPMKRKWKKKGFTLVKVYLYDELPRIGSGYRFVFAKEGRKWVHIKGYNNVNGKLPLKRWKELQPEAA